MARILIVGGGCRGRRLARTMVQDGYAVRICTRTEASRDAIEAAGAECWIGTPDRLATLRGALDSATILCWLLGGAVGPPHALHALHTSRLEFFLTQAIDSTVRGVVYEARGTTSPALLVEGERVVRELARANAIPAAFLIADPDDAGAWLLEAREAIASLLGGE